MYFIGAAEEWVLQGTDQTEGQGGGWERSGLKGQGVWGRSGGNSCKDFGNRPCSNHQLRQAGDQQRPLQHRKHIPAWILDAQSQEIDRDTRIHRNCCTMLESIIEVQQKNATRVKLIYLSEIFKFQKYLFNSQQPRKNLFQGYFTGLYHVIVSFSVDIV